MRIHLEVCESTSCMYVCVNRLASWVSHQQNVFKPSSMCACAVSLSPLWVIIYVPTQKYIHICMCYVHTMCVRWLWYPSSAPNIDSSDSTQQHSVEIQYYSCTLLGAGMVKQRSRTVYTGPYSWIEITRLQTRPATTLNISIHIFQAEISCSSRAL